jgi:hypothetical protein
LRSSTTWWWSTDEVYEHLVFEGRHTPIETLPGMDERTLTISSAGKTFSFTGWKIGWVTGPAELVDAVRTVKQYLTYVNGTPFQHAAAVGLGLGDDYFEAFVADLRAKRDLLCGGLADAGFEVYPPAGTYFVVASVSPLGTDDGYRSASTCPTDVGWSRSPTWSSISTPSEDAPWCGSRSRSASRCWRKRLAASGAWLADGQDRSATARASSSRVMSERPSMPASFALR